MAASADDGPPAATTAHAITTPHPTLAVGVDFGTYATGFAYCELADGHGGGSDPRVRLHLAWPDQPTSDPKTRTAVLYQGRHLEAWGWTAWRRWSSMGREERSAGAYSYLTGFKLLLEEEVPAAAADRGGGVGWRLQPGHDAAGGGGGGGGGGLDGGGDCGSWEGASSSELGHSPARLRSALRESLPAGLTALQVVTDFLEAVRRYIAAHLVAQRLPHGGFHPDRVVWCLTLPAMWSDAAKDKIRRAALRAGFIRTLSSSSLLLTLEPEAAALCAAHAAVPRQLPSAATGGAAGPSATSSPTESTGRGDGNGGGSSTSAEAGGSSTTLEPGDVLLVLDCGGGTVDVTMHRVVAAWAPSSAVGPAAAAAADSASGAAAGAAAAATQEVPAGRRVHLRDAAVGDGVLAGGCFVDDALWACVREALGADPWDTWVGEHPADWTRLRDTWEQAKRTFVGLPPQWRRPRPPAGALTAESSVESALAAGLLPNLLRPAFLSSFWMRSRAADAEAKVKAQAEMEAHAEAEEQPLIEQVKAHDWSMLQEALAAAPGGPQDQGDEARGADGDDADAGDVEEDGSADDGRRVRLEGMYDVCLRLPQSLMDALPPDVRKDLERCGRGGPAGAPSASAAAAAEGLGGPSRPWLLSSAVLPCLVLPGELLERRVFGPVVDQVVALARRVAEEGRRNGLPATKVLLAGGFAGSPYLQRRVRSDVAEALGPSPLPLLLPKYPAAAVVTGAALYGRDPRSVSARAVRLSYGLAATAPWSDAHEASRAARGYPERAHNPEDDSYFADEVFAAFVARGQLVEAEEVVEHFVAPLHKSQDSIFFDLYGTHARDAVYIREPGMRRLGGAVLRLPEGWQDCAEVQREGSWGYIVRAELRFGATEIMLTARNPRTNEVVSTSVDWSSDVAAAAVRMP